MCFSPTADLVGSVVIGAIGVDVLRNVHRRHDHWAFAALPLLFGIHQFVETFVWWGLDGTVPHAVGTVAMWIYLLFAFVVLPTYVPVAIRTLEPPGTRRQIMDGFVALGLAVSITLAIAMFRGPVTATDEGHHIQYGIDLAYSVPIVGAYVLATCASALFSGYRQIALFGVVNLAAVAVIAALIADGFASVWCGWAAVTSAAIAVYIRHTRPNRRVVEALA